MTKRRLMVRDPRRAVYERTIELEMIVVVCRYCGASFSIEHVPGSFLPRVCERHVCQHQRADAKRAVTRARVERLRQRRAAQPGVTTPEQAQSVLPQPGVTGSAHDPGAVAPAARVAPSTHEQALDTVLAGPDGVEFKDGRRHWLGSGGKTLCGLHIPDTPVRYTRGELPTCRRCRGYLG
jgi:hypothetical protein